MLVRLFAVFLGLMVVVVAPSSFAADVAAAKADDGVRHLEFMMAHKPDNPQNVALLQEFADHVREKTGGKIDIKLTNAGPLSLSENDSTDTHLYALKKVYTGEVAMSQISVKRFLDISPYLDVLDMAFVFRSHEHASKVLDGDIGAHLLQTVNEGSNGHLKGLAFTYSGGFRDIYSTADLNGVADLAGMKTRFMGGRMSRDVMDFLGLQAEYVPYMTKTWRERHMQDNQWVDEAEIIRIMTYNQQVRDSIKTVLETQHNLYLTLITMNGPIFASLTPEEQSILQAEVNDLAHKERSLSIKQADEGKAALEKAGVKFVPMSDADKAILRRVAVKAHQKHEKDLGYWIDAIEAVGKQSAFNDKSDDSSRQDAVQ